MAEVIEQSYIQQLTLGRDFGIISYNDTPLKKNVVIGITTISTDFIAKRKIVAQMVLLNEKEKIDNTSQLICKSLL